MIATTTTIREIIAKRLDQDVAVIVDQASLVQDLGADSLDVIELGMDLEEALKVDVDDDAIERWKTVGDVVAWFDGLPQ